MAKTKIMLAAFLAFCIINSIQSLSMLTRKAVADSLPNIESPTLGGKYVWRDTFLHAGWRIQENILTGHFRLLDPDNVRHAWGTANDVQNTFSTLRRIRQIHPKSSHLVILIHGILPAINPFADMQQRLRDAGFDATMVSYPSTHDTIEVHADGIDKLLNRLHETKTISFVTHSMGGLVLRQLLASSAAWQKRISIDRAVMVAPPNQGSAIARTLKDFEPFKLLYGVSGQQLTPEMAQTLPGLNIPFIVIAGGLGDGAGYNPILEGDDDGTVTVAETRLDGAENFYLVPDTHTAIGDNPRTIKMTIDYLKSGP